MGFGQCAVQEDIFIYLSIYVGYSSRHISNFTLHFFHLIRATHPDHRMEALIFQHLTDDAYFPRLVVYVYIWVHLLFSQKPLKVQSCSSPHHHRHEKWSYCIILNKNFNTSSSVHLQKRFCLFLTSGSGGEVDSSYHLLDLFFILQYVGPHGTNLILLVVDQLIQFSQFCFERLHRSVCRSAADKKKITIEIKLC